MENLDIKECLTCKKVLLKTAKYCSQNCYKVAFSIFRTGYKHSEETKKKIAKSNSKPFTEIRKKNISLSKQYVVDDILLSKLKELWALTYINPLTIKKIVGMPRRSRIYESLKKKYCEHKQHKFMPSDWYPEHYSKLIELSSQNIWFRKIAKILGFGQNQVFSVMKKLGLKINTRNPDAYACIISSVELKVINWIKDAGFEVDTQYALGNFLYDGHIKNTNILIEVNGDYWHCNPKIYKNGPINNMQKSHIKRDFAKKAFSSREGYYQITLWENDIKKTPNEIKDWMLKKINDNMKDENDRKSNNN
jgi:very-short-patch-repair endonuclease